VRDKAASSYYGLPTLSDQELLNAYRGAWLPRKIVDIPAFDSVGAWRDWQADGEDIGPIEAEENRLNVRAKVLDARIKARLWGGAKALSVGEVSTAAKQDGQLVMLPLILKDAAAIKAMVSGKRELSAGYVCELDWTPGLTADGEAYDAQQRSIKINHLALVDRARAGSQARIGDAGNWGAAPISWQIWWRDTRTQLSLLIVLNGVPNCGRYDGLYRRSCRNSWNGSGRHGFDRADSDNNRRGQAVVSSPSVRARTRAIQVS